MPLLPPPSDLVAVHQAATEFEARTIHSLLEAAGIPAMVRSRLVPGYQVAVPPGLWGEVLVAPADAPAARVVIIDYLRSLAPPPEEASRS
ncbi:MAG: DUF2007 domain-containing protein [Armatimonadota bacterium]|nr:DUF2007 domain-containing protein [Armatimonadota bacterium]MDR7453248.1 DUF2007 domain-containing protein [Armatimonadota bacterium]MDR7455864.1 DUF2007 domain-containing protein [Armatimonadota bacterium]MDR7497105.1 DUF2007 domain-containing protein [Armatimonadota bacterium]MDR7511905.1 DUF2007 domain-containing protein [Armatimonadota bacterium]